MRTLAPFFLTVLLFAASGLQAFQSAPPALTDAEKSIMTELRGLRKVPDDQRGATTKQIALEIRKLPPDASKVNLAAGLASLSTEGDFGHATLQEVAITLAAALQEQPTAAAEAYSELAQLVRYEHVQVSLDSAPFKAAMSTLEARTATASRATSPSPISRANSGL